MDSWEDEADNFPSGAGASPAGPALQGTDKWEGEDEDDVPDSWDAEPEPAAATGDKKPADASATASTKPKKRSKQLAAALGKREQEAEEKRRLAAEEAAKEQPKELSKADLQRLQEEDDLLVAKDTFGVNDPTPAASIDPQRSIDLLQPVSKEDFDNLCRLMSQKLRQYETSPHYAGFVESLFRDCTLEVECETLRKLATMFSALANEKQKLQKTAAGGKAKKKGKGSLVVERGAAAAIEEDFGYDEYDDFI